MDRTPFTRRTLFHFVMILTLVVSLAGTFQPGRAASVWYVKPVGTGLSDCTSWENACRLGFALDLSVSGDEIWVMTGTHKPGAQRTGSFHLENGVAVYGGFAGTETSLDQRDPALNVTTLSGDIGVEGDISDNTYHVVTGADDAILDGVTISGGNANGATPDDMGGGMYNDAQSPILMSVVFSSNTATNGGGMANTNSSSPILTDVFFDSNDTALFGDGGGIYNYLSSPNLSKVTFFNNAAVSGDGGAIFNDSSSPTLVNVTIEENQAFNGSGLYNLNSSPTLTNVTIANNLGAWGAIYNESSSPVIRNTILWSNSSNAGQIVDDANSHPVVSDCVIFNGYPGGTNIITADPLIGSLGDHGGHILTDPLLAGSSAIDTGSDSVCPAEDQRGVDRPFDAHCDIGAYEYIHGVYYVTPEASGERNCQSWEDSCTLRYALTMVSSGDEIWVAAGAHLPGPDQGDTFQLVGGVELYGGFNGTETAHDQRNPALNVTVLSGDIGMPGVTSDNSLFVVTGVDDTLLDGLTISYGLRGMENVYASPTLNNVIFNANIGNYNGGGMHNDHASPMLTNVVFSGNMGYHGGAMYNEYDSNPSLVNVLFENNSTNHNGGAVFNIDSSPSFVNVTFNDNSTSVYGGGIYNELANPTLVNVTFNNNTAGIFGGGMYNKMQSNPTLTHVTFTDNSAEYGGGIFNSGASRLEIRNAIFWENTAGTEGDQIENYATLVISDSIVQGGFPGGWNIITDDPLLGELGDYGGPTQTIPIGLGGSALDAAEDSACPPTDQRGVTRPQGDHCDIGAFELDYVPPTVVSSQRIGHEYTNASYVQYLVTFSEEVNDVGLPDFSLTTGAGLTGAELTDVIGSGSVYTVTASTGIGAGTLRLDLPVTAVISDTSGNLMVDLPYEGGESFLIDKLAPTVVSSLRLDPNPTNATRVDFLVTFSEPVYNVGVQDFWLTTSAITGTAVTTVTGSSEAYTVTVDTGIGEGTIRLDLPAEALINDELGNMLVDLPYEDGESYQVDTVAPAVVSSLRADPNPTNADTVVFTVTFSEEVIDVDLDDFDLTVSGVTGAFVYSMEGVGSIYTVTVDSGTGSGTIRLDIPSNATISDPIGNPLADLPYTAGEDYDIDKTAPTVVSSVRIDPNPTSSESVKFLVTFSEPVGEVDVDDFSLTVDGISGAEVTGVIGSGGVYTVTVSTGTGNGTVRLDVPDGAVIGDLVGNPLVELPYTEGEVYTIVHLYYLFLPLAVR